jgi:hypothetical protein
VQAATSLPKPLLLPLSLLLPHVVLGLVRSGHSPPTLLRPPPRRRALPQPLLLPLSLLLPHVVLGLVRSGHSPPTLLRPPPRRRALPQLQTLLPLPQLQTLLPLPQLQALLPLPQLQTLLPLPQLQTLPPPLQVGSYSLSAAKTGASGAVIWAPSGLRQAPQGCGLNCRA